MHARHRSPGNGYRSGPMGMGFGASRVSPDGSARGRGFYNSEQRNVGNRGFGRGQGQPKTFPLPLQPPVGRTDVLMEAGRLAAEYLVSKGLLPRNVLNGKWQSNSSFKKQVGGYQDFRQQEDLPLEERTPAQLRLGPGVSDVRSGRRRYPDDFDLKNNVKGRRRGEYNRSYGSEWGREYGRSGSWSDTSKVSREMEEEDDSVSVKNDEQIVAKGDGDATPKSSSSGLAPEIKEMGNLEPQLENTNYPGDTTSKANSPTEIISKANSSTVENEQTGQGPLVMSIDSKNLNTGNEEKKNSAGDFVDEKQILKDNSPVQQCATDDNLSANDNSDLLALCRFTKVPTRARSPLTCMTSKVDSVSVKEEENGSEAGTVRGPAIFIQEVGQDISAAQNSKSSKSETSVISENSTEHGQQLASVFGDVHRKCLRSQSFPDKAFMHFDKELSSDDCPSIKQSNSVEDRGEKRALEDGVVDREAKKPREWLPSLFNKVHAHLNPSNLSERTFNLLGERASSYQQAVENANERAVNHVQYSEIGVNVKYAQEKQLFPSSFKICDLNLMEASDLNDSNSNGQVLTYPSTSTSGTDAEQVDIDLSISNQSMSRQNPRHTSSFKNIEVIDLENESIPEDMTFDNLNRKMEPANTGNDGFSSHAHNAGDITDVQDNYEGLMIPEFLATFSNCSTVPADINPLQNDMGLPNGAGTLGDDDSIYMSLGEIPFSFIPTWEQPMPQEYEKPF